MELQDEEIIQEIELQDEEDSIDWISLSKGLKDYEPDFTSIQNDQLQKSLEIMYGIISTPITINSKNIMNSYLKNHNGIIPKPKGSFLNSIGLINRSNECILNFVEFLYLISRGSINPQFENQSIDLDLMNIYTEFENEEEIEKFWCYSNLKRLGYVVMNYKEFIEDNKLNLSIFQMINFKILNFFKSFQNFIKNYLIKPINYEILFHQIKLNFNKIQISNDKIANYDFNIWKPSIKFIKTNPIKPNYRLKILSNDTKLTIDNLYPNSLLAIVQDGIINYVNFEEIDLSNGPI
ncbi:hypothetical protein WICMUC_003602 [Wickerhamomyces mucosus]|uniref:tRNA-splicing endonuclease subunit Sen54 N-terminal domain-containing protein n=1 Tax=Wickerhamomyces mucosus TaxID=1378264 RepID=A0A9P8PK46_9ASCO|nr:hypothetical protein WICMUC_003602 [Wickerhamomyces mucosus]